MVRVTVVNVSWDITPPPKTHWETLYNALQVGINTPLELRYAVQVVDEEVDLASEVDFTNVPVVTITPTPTTAVLVELIGLPWGMGKQLRLWRQTKGDGRERVEYFNIEELEYTFVDTGQLGVVDTPRSPKWVHYESGIRWSDPYQPYSIRPESFIEIRPGDGQRITGLVVLYGNLVVFKENCICRLAVQGGDPPISRVDVVADDVGCIAPNTLITIRNTVYFLSWQGLMMYDNNVVRHVDERFNRELREALTNIPLSTVRLASCGYDPRGDELILYIPARLYFPGRWFTRLHSPIQPVWWREMYGDENASPTFWGNREAAVVQDYGRAWVIKLSTGFVTKYSWNIYGLENPGLPWTKYDILGGGIPEPPTTRVLQGSSMRGTVPLLLYTDKNGVLYLAETEPHRVYHSVMPGEPPPTPYVPAMIYVGNLTNYHGAGALWGIDEYLPLTDAPPANTLGWLLASLYSEFPGRWRGYQWVHGYMRTAEMVADDKMASKRVVRWGWQVYQPTRVTMPEAFYLRAIVTEFSRGGYERGIAGVLYSLLQEDVVDAGLQVWMLGNTLTIPAVGFAGVPNIGDQFQQDSASWALGTWVPGNDQAPPSAANIIMTLSPGMDVATKPYRYSSVIETWGDAIVNGASHWVRTMARFLR